MDTKEFDDKIIDLQKQIEVIQTDLDSDPFQVQLKAAQAKEENIRTLTFTLNEIQSKRNQAISLQTQIDANAQAIVDIKATIQ